MPNSIVLRNERNIYVNPAWNQACQYLLMHSMGEYFCLCNNDIIAGERWLEPIFKLFATRKDEFYIPISNGQYNTDCPYWDRGEFERYVRKTLYEPLQARVITESFAGFVIFMRTKHIRLFYPIPEVLKVLRGDDWIVDCLLNNCVYPMRVNQCAIHHYGSATQRGMDDAPAIDGLNFSQLRDRDSEEFEKIKRNLFPARNMWHISAHKWKIKLL